MNFREIFEKLLDVERELQTTKEALPITRDFIKELKADDTMNFLIKEQLRNQVDAVSVAKNSSKPEDSFNYTIDKAQFKDIEDTQGTHFYYSMNDEDGKYVLTFIGQEGNRVLLRADFIKRLRELKEPEVDKLLQQLEKKKISASDFFNDILYAQEKYLPAGAYDLIS